MFCILCDLPYGIAADSSANSASVYIIAVALDLVCADTICFDAFLELVSLFSGTRHVMINELVA